MRVSSFVASALLLVPSTATAKTYGVVVVKEGTATAAQMGEARSALRSGIAAAAGNLIDDVTTMELMRIADPATGACDEACESKMRAELPSSTLVLARLSANPTHFALRVRGGGPEYSAAGATPHLAAAAKQLGNRLASSAQGTIVIEGARDAKLYVDGTPVSPAKNGSVPVAPGLHIVRLGDGMGPGAMLRIDVPPGETVRITFPGERSSARPEATPTSLASPPKRTHASIATTAGVAIVSRAHSLSGADGGGFDTTFAGAGPSISAEIDVGALAVLEAAWITYRFSNVRFDLGDDDTSTATGGTTMRARAAGGWRFSRGTDSPSLAPLLGVSFEQHTADDPKSSSGALGLLVDHTRLAVDVELRAALPLAGVARLDAGLGVSPRSSWQESPKTLGSSPRASITPFWHVGADLVATRPWILRAEYTGELRAVTHSGTASASAATPLRDTKVEQTFHGLTLALQRQF